MSNRTDKNWNRPWSPEEILENAENWSLAGDAALLNTLKNFADNLLTKTGAISDRLDSLLNNLNEAGVKLDLAQNEFQSLRNTQFIESRVYEDDETLDSKEEEKVSEKPISGEEQEKQIVEFIKNGITILDDYYDKVEVSVSDSEEESERRSYLFQPRNLYEHRQLPPVIGTDEWKKWHLDEASGESETDEEPEIYSSGDSEDNLPKNLLKGSETSSELDFSSQISGNRPIVNSSFNDSVPQADLASSSESSDNQDSLPVKTPISSKSFAEELAAKLGNVISEQEDISSQINRKPIQPVKSNTFTGNLFADEPPPLDIPEGSTPEKNTRSRLFSGGQGLFDDGEEDELFSDQQAVKSEERKEHFVSKQEKIEAVLPALQKPGLAKSSQVSRGLFDSDESSDDGIFATHREPAAKQPFLQPNKPVVPLFDDEPPKIEENTPDQPVRKKPPGGVSIFGSSDILGNQKISDILKNQNRQNVARRENKEPALETKDTVDTSKVAKAPTKSQWKDLFDDSDSELSQKKEESDASKIKTSSLFDDDTEEILPKKSVVEKKQKNLDLFNNSDNEEKFSDIKNSMLERNTVGQFGDSSNILEKPKKISLFDDEDEVLPQKTEIAKVQIEPKPKLAKLFENTPTTKTKPKKISLFDDDDDDFFEEDDLFSNIPTTKTNSGIFDDLDLFGSNLHKKGEDEKKIEEVEYNKTYRIEEQNVVKQEPVISDEKPAGQLIYNRRKVLSLFSDSSDDDKKNEDEKITNITTKPEKNDTEKGIVISKNPSLDNKTELFAGSSENGGNNGTKTEEQINKKVETLTNIVESKDKKEPSQENLMEPHKAIEKIKKVSTLFHDSEDEVDDALFSSIEKEVKNIDASIDKIEDSQDNVTQNIVDREVVGAEEEIPRTKLTTSLFEDFASDDLFKTAPAAPQIQDSTKSKTPDEQKSADSQLDSTYQDIDKGQRIDINIFGSSPPPDDGDDWEVKSDSLSDPDDYLSYHAQNNLERSSLFDNEPPSLVSNESSGIVKNFSGSRVETEYSSFYPDASSSRRLSSDIFNEQQSQDSFFVTKTNSEPPTIPSNLNVIAEASTSSIVEITPSGDIKDFNTTTNTDISQKTLPSADTSNDKYESIEPGNPRDNFLNKEKQSFTDKFASDRSDTEVENPNFEKPVQTTMKSKIATISELLKNKPLGMPPQFRKSQSLDGESSLEKATSKDVMEVENVEVLHCVTKDRAKIPIKRRPSTRRGRQAAIRKSAADILVQDDSKNENNGQPEYHDTETSDKLVNDKNIKVSQSTFEDTTSVEQSFASVPNENLAPKTTESKHTVPLIKEVNPSNITTSKTEEPKNDTIETKEKSLLDDELFPTSKKATARKSKGLLFDSGDESDSDLFGDISSKKAKTETVKKGPKSEPKQKKVSKKALFDDGSSDEELFSGSKGKQKNEPAAVSTKTTKNAPVRKLQNMEADDDPLSTLLK